MFRTLEEDDADTLWREAAAWFINPNEPVAVQTGRGGHTREVLRAALTLRDPRRRWIASRTPAINPAFAIAEVIWIMSGRNDAAFLNYFNSRLPDFAGRGETYHGAYGYRLRKHFGIDQLRRVCEALSANSGSRQAVLQIWDPRIDLPGHDGSARAEDIPCNVTALLKVRDGRLEWTQVMRGNDLFRGLPYNIIQFSCLQEILSGWLGLSPGAYHHFADSLHVYEKDIPALSGMDPALPPPPAEESVAMPMDASERSFSGLSALGDVLSSRVADEGDVLRAFDETDIHPAFRSWAAVLTAEALRRRSAFGMMERVMESCSSPCLTLIFERWLKRCGNAGGIFVI